MKERKIEFKDIRVGDTIRFEWDLLDAHDTRTGVVAKVDEERATTAQGATLAHTDWKGHTYFLVDRPKPKLPTEPGALIKVTQFGGASGEWLAKLASDGLWGVFETTGDDDMYWARSHLIEEWCHIELREVDK
jgi:hypothetical protein